MTTQLLQISDRVRVGGKLGTVIAVEPRPQATIYTIAFTKGLPQKFISPPTAIEKLLRRCLNLSLVLSIAWIGGEIYAYL